MRRVFKWIVGVLGGVALPLVAEADPFGPQDMPVFLFAGQSNMVGHALPRRIADGAEVKAHLVYAYPEAYNLPPDGIDRRNMMRFGPEYGFVKAMQAAGMPRFRVLKAAIGGTALSPRIDTGRGNWHPDTAGGLFDGMVEAYDRLDSTLRAEGLTPRIAGMFWVQGASDTGDLDRYAAHMADLFRAAEAVWGKDLFVGIAETTYSEGWYLDIAPPAFVRRAEMFEQIRQVQRRFAKGRRQTVLLSTKGFATVDGLHFTPSASFDLGVGFANAWLAHQGLPRVALAPPATLDKAARSREEFLRLRTERQEKRRRDAAGE